MKKKYTIVGIHDNGLGWIVHAEACDAKEALRLFDSMDKGFAISVFDGHIVNRVNRMLTSGSPTELES